MGVNFGQLKKPAAKTQTKRTQIVKQQAGSVPPIDFSKQAKIDQNLSMDELIERARLAQKEFAAQNALLGRMDSRSNQRISEQMERNGELERSVAEGSTDVLKEAGKESVVTAEQMKRIIESTSFPEAEITNISHDILYATAYTMSSTQIYQRYWTPDLVFDAKLYTLSEWLLKSGYVGGASMKAYWNSRQDAILRFIKEGIDGGMIKIIDPKMKDALKATDVMKNSAKAQAMIETEATAVQLSKMTKFKNIVIKGGKWLGNSTVRVVTSPITLLKILKYGKTIAKTPGAIPAAKLVMRGAARANWGITGFFTFVIFMDLFNESMLKPESNDIAEYISQLARSAQDWDSRHRIDRAAGAKTGLPRLFQSFRTTLSGHSPYYDNLVALALTRITTARSEYESELDKLREENRKAREALGTAFMATSVNKMMDQFGDPESAMGKPWGEAQ